MPKTNILIIIFLALIIPISIAQDAEIIILKDEYKNLETLQGELVLNNIQLSKDITISNLKLTDFDMNNLPLSKNIIKVNSSNYLFYFDIPSLSNGSYKIVFSDVFYAKDGTAKKANFEKDIQISAENEALSIKPGYYLTKLKTYEEAKFSLLLKSNLEHAQNVEIITDEIINANIKKFILNKGQTKTIEVNTKVYSKQGEYFSTNLQIKHESGNYSLPIIIFREAALNTTNKTNTATNISSNYYEKNISLENAISITDSYGSRIDTKIKIRKEISYNANITIKNNINISLNNISIIFTSDLPDAITSTPNSIQEIKPNGKARITININKNKNLDKNYTGEIIVKSKEGAETKIPIELIVIYTENSQPDTINDIQTPINATKKAEKTSENGNRTAFWIVVAITLLLFLLIIFIIYSKGKPKQRRFERFIEESRGRQ